MGYILTNRRKTAILGVFGWFFLSFSEMREYIQSIF